MGLRVIRAGEEKREERGASLGFGGLISRGFMRWSLGREEESRG